MNPIIHPIDSSLLKAELTPDRLLCRTHHCDYEIYIVSGHESPHVMCEIARLREISFRHRGGGTGLPADLDDFDLIPGIYRQLIIWSPHDKAILGGYRFACGHDVLFDYHGTPFLASSSLYHFSEKFIRERLPYTIELGYSFVRHEYRYCHMGNRCLYVLDNLWDGFMALIVHNPHLKWILNLTSRVQTFDIASNNGPRNVEKSAMLIDMYHITEEKRRRHFPT